MHDRKGICLFVFVLEVLFVLGGGRGSWFYRSGEFKINQTTFYDEIFAVSVLPALAVEFSLLFGFSLSAPKQWR